MDFAQPGPICTLQQLNPAHALRLEEELEQFVRARPITLILPCHASEIEQPATLERVCKELAGARWLREVIIGMNGLDAKGLARARTCFARWLPLPHRVLWTDCPDLQRSLPVEHPRPTGKALNVWTALGVVCAEKRSQIIVTQDCDVRSFRRETLARLCYACAHPQLDFAFAKLFYARATDRLYGRVSRLFLAPLLRTLQHLAVGGELIEFLRAFRYPLAGECAMQRDLAARLRTHSGWGLEIGMLCEVHRHLAPQRVCQAEDSNCYDHRHHSSESGVLDAMAADVAGALLANLPLKSTDSLFRASPGLIMELFRTETADAIRHSAALALINGLHFDEASERRMVERFTRKLEALVTSDAVQVHAISGAPPWTEILTSDEAGERFLKAIAAHQDG